MMDRDPGRRPDSLLEKLQGLIERTYDIERSILQIATFVIGDEGYRRITAGREVVRRLEAASPGPAVLLRRSGGRWQASLYYPDSLVRRLERQSPLRRLDEANLVPFSLFVEELDHLLLVADRLRVGRPVSLLELEFHANVTKELVARHFWARHRRRQRLSERDREWVGRRLREPGDYRHLDPGLRTRYREAARTARDYLRWFDRQPRAVRPAELRRFHRRGWQQHVRFLRENRGPGRSRY